MPGEINIPGKGWAYIQARAALVGRELIRSHPDDGPPRIFLIGGGGALRELRTADDVEGLLNELAAASTA